MKMPKIVYPRTCSMCTKSYKSRQTFSAHKEACMGLMRQCLLCSRTYCNKSTFLKHKKECQQEKSMKNSHIECPDPKCGSIFYHKTILIKHLQDVHLKMSESIELFFSNFEEFELWKEEESIFCNSRFIKICGDKSNKRYYACQLYHNRELKTIPSTKCLSRILVDMVGTEMRIIYFPVHNHEPYFSNTKSEQGNGIRNFIKQCILLGVPSKEIQKYIRNGVEDNTENCFPAKEYFSRSSYICSYKNKSKSSMKVRSDDAAIINSLVNDLSMKEFNPVFLYKPQRKSVVIGPPELDSIDAPDLFVLALQEKSQLEELLLGIDDVLCINIAQGLKPCDCFLLTIFVRDMFGKGYPVSYLISSQLDVHLLTIFFIEFKRKLGNKSIKTIISDDDVSLFTSVQNAFGEVAHYVCTWHLLRTWNHEIIYQVPDEDMQIKIFDALYSIHREKNIDAFKSLLNTFISTYKTKASEFINYFLAYYFIRPKVWALCYSNFPQGYTDSNILCESFHNKLKLFHCEERTMTRINELIKNLLEINKDFFLSNLYRNLTQDITKNDKQHDEGMKIPFSAVKYKDNKWHVQSQTVMDIFYIVQRVHDSCPTPDHCSFNCKGSCVGLCLHMYHCSCPDRIALCKHIHRVHKIRKEESNNVYEEQAETNDIHEEQSEANDSHASLNQLKENSDNDGNNGKSGIFHQNHINEEKKLRSEGKSLLEQVIKVYNEIPDTMLNQANSSIKNLLSICRSFSGGNNEVFLKSPL